MKTIPIFLVMALTYLQPLIAEQTTMMAPLPWQGQMGVMGALCSLVWWLIAKTIPTQAKQHSEVIQQVLDTHTESSKIYKECSETMSCDLKGLRADINTHQQEQIRTLKEIVAKER